MDKDNTAGNKDKVDKKADKKRKVNNTEKAMESMVSNTVKSVAVKKIDKNVHPHVQTSSFPLIRT
ncbi:hypothetical protein GJ688_18440 [Heliobacillus mobilis]|uniref:Uncharacterized protein n=1 Tax=Heliobacterium mobile TaxID=28064 RepID=A0A6I3SPF3_HELMO|nr:hypothetical protein [Heliobacterium mobile]